MLRWPLDPMRAVSSRELPDGDSWLYEPKWDGFRLTAWHTPAGIRLQSRAGTDLTARFPDLAVVLARHLPPKTVVDGEVCVWDEQRGRTSFSLLQRRLTAGRGILAEAARHPAHLVAFDVLRDGRGTDLTGQPLTVRRRRLRRLLEGGPAQLTLCPQTADLGQAEQWMAELAVAGIEGVVAKPAASPYRPGQAGWVKVRSRETADYVIGGVTGSLARPTSLLLGRFDRHGMLRFVAHTHPLKADQRRDLVPLLQPLPFQGAGHPWPRPLPSTWTGIGDKQPIPYVPVEPLLVAEVEVDTALDGPFGRARHGCRHVRVRLDMHPDGVAAAGEPIAVP